MRRVILVIAALIGGALAISLVGWGIDNTFDRTPTHAPQAR